MLGSVHIVDDMVAVPVSNTADMTRQSGADFVAAAEALGLEVDVSYGQQPPLREGMIIDVQPATGAVLGPGDVVHLTLVGSPE